MWTNLLQRATWVGIPMGYRKSHESFRTVFGFLSRTFETQPNFSKNVDPIGASMCNCVVTPVARMR
jgi:hypothetical protein